MPAKKTVSKEDTDLKKAKEEKDKRFKDFLSVLGSVDKFMKKQTNSEDSVVALLQDMSVDVQRFSSGSFVLDTITGGGFPHGRIIELYGPESSGKTSIALNAVANVQKEGGNAVFVDAENAFDPHYATTLGVDVNSLGFSQSTIAEDVFNMSIKLAESGNVDLIVVDSVASLAPRAEAEGSMDKQQMGALARVMSKGLRLLTPICAKNNCTIIFLNQIREKVGIMFGNPETTPGGKALKFYASQRIEVRRKEVVKEGNTEIGTKVRLKVIKNKVAAPFGEGFTVLTFAHGINHTAEIIVVGAEKNRIYQKSAQSAMYYNPLHPENIKDGGFKTAPEEIEGVQMYKLGRGQKNSMETLAEDNALYRSLASDIKEILDAERNGDLSFANKDTAPDDKENEDVSPF